MGIAVWRVQHSELPARVFFLRKGTQTIEEGVEFKIYKRVSGIREFSVSLFSPLSRL